MKRSPTPKRVNASVTKASILIDVEVDGERQSGRRDGAEESPARHLSAERKGWRDCHTGSNVQVPETCLHSAEQRYRFQGRRKSEEKKKPASRSRPGGDVEVENIGWTGGRVAGMFRGDGDLQRTLAAPSSFEDPVVPTAVNHTGHWPGVPGPSRTARNHCRCS